MPNVLETERLQVAYGEREVVRGIDMKIAAGKVTAIVGPSGCGKTTLLRTLNRLTELSEKCRVHGRVTLDGDDIFALDPVLLRRRVGMVFQDPNPFPMSVKDNVLYGVKAQGNRGSREILETSLRKAVLWDEVKDRLHSSALTLSGGQQQRLCIARCLAVSPEVVLMDEPARSLDPGATLQLEASILAMQSVYTVVIVTHDVQEARRVSDYTAFMLEGRVVEFGPTQELFETPASGLTRDYLAGRLVTAEAVAAI
jgi:phosphate transport system ATP-binding protein